MFKGLLKYVGYFTGAASAIGVIIGVYVYLESIPRKAEKSSDTVKEYVKAYADTTFFLINRIESTLYSQDKKIDRLDGRVDNINASYVNHLKTDNKLDELIKYFESTQEQLKKNGNYLFPIVLNQDSLRIR